MLEAMSPEVRAAYLQFRTNTDTAASPVLTAAMLRNAMVFEKAFVAAGGLLAAGVDPTGVGGALAGFGDQRNYELLVEAGFTPAQTIQIMTANGAKILGVYDKLGSIERGKLADLVVLNGDLAKDPSVIRNVTTVFKDGVGYDSAKMIAAVKGRVGID
jgi:predicted amidohydrolase YtcJ